MGNYLNIPQDSILVADLKRHRMIQVDEGEISKLNQ